MSKLVSFFALLLLFAFSYAQKLNFESVEVKRTVDLKTLLAVGTIKYDNWDSCEDEKSKYGVVCDFVDHTPTEKDFPIRNIISVNCGGNAVSKNVTKAYAFYGCVLFEREKYISHGVEYVDPPTFVGNYRVQRKEDLSKFFVSGKMNYKWETCEVKKENFNLLCSFFEHVPTLADYTDLTPISIDCDGTVIPTESKNSKDHYFGCVMQSKSDSSIIANIVTGTPILNIDSWSLKISPELADHELRGKMQIEWEQCPAGTDGYHSICHFFDHVPVPKDFNRSKGMDMELECGGWPWQVIWTENLQDTVYGCLLYKQKTEFFLDMRYIEVPRLNLEDIVINEDNGKWTSSNSIKYNWKNCNDFSKDYKYDCKFTENVPTIHDFSNQGNDINCEGNEIKIESKSLTDGYLSCAILRKSNNDVVNLNYKSTIGTNLQNVVLSIKDNKIHSYGKILFNWAKCSSESSDYVLEGNFFETIPDISSFNGQKIEIKCDGSDTESLFTSTLANRYLVIRLKKGDVTYDYESILMPSFKLDLLDFGLTEYYNHREISGIIPYNYPNCLSNSKKYSMICDFTTSLPTYELLIPKYQNDIMCSGFPVHGIISTSMKDRYFGCMIIDREHKGYTTLASAELPGVSTSNFTISHVDGGVEISGKLKYDWDSCEPNGYLYSCLFTNTTPNEASFKGIERHQIDCNGNKISVKNVPLQFFACALFRITVSKNDAEELMDLQYIELPSFNMDLIDLSVTNDVWIPNGYIQFNWLSCGKSHDSYELRCEYNDNEPKSVNIEKSTSFPINCGGTEINNLTTAKCSEIYLGCSLVQKADKQVFDFHFIHAEGDNDSTKTLLLIIAGVIAAVSSVAVICFLSYIVILSKRSKGTLDEPLLSR